MTFTNSATKPNNPFIIALRQKAATVLLEKISLLMTKVHHPHSGKIMEAIMGLLPDDQFDTLSALVLNHEDEELVQQFCAHISVRLGSMIGLNGGYSQFFYGSQNVGLIILCEQRRRAGEIIYDFPNDFFSDIANSPQQFMRLTENGKNNVVNHLLQHFESDVVQ